MVGLARKNLMHDKLRFASATVGITVSIVLVLCLIGLYLACCRHASGLVDQAGGDLWIMARGTACVDRSEPISERRFYQALSTPGVLWAEPLLVRITQWRLADGRREVAEIVGTRPGTRLNVPWGQAHSDPGEVRRPYAVVIDERERGRFGRTDGPLRIGDKAEIFDRTATVAAFTKGIDSFTAVPYVFATHELAAQYTGTPDDSTTFVIIKVRPGEKVDEVGARLARRLPEVDIRTAAEFSSMTRRYWLTRTGVGAAVIFAASLGLAVGCVMVSQTIYASTISRLSEYATLKALGLSNLGLSGIVVEQAFLLGLLSFGFAAVIATWMARRAVEWNLSIDTPGWLYGFILLITMATCLIASVTSILRVFKLSPVSVFGSN